MFQQNVTFSIDTAQPGIQKDAFEANYLNPRAIRFYYEGENLTFVDENGTVHPQVTLRRCFPLSAENTYILIRLPEEEHDRGHELGILADSQELDESSGQALERELRQHYLVPSIQRVLSIREEFGFLYWSVETDRGQKEFIMRDSIISSTRQVASNRWLIIDINQTRYEVHDLTSLDDHSQALVRRFLLL